MGADPVKEFEAYRKELLDLLGDRDALQVMARTADELDSQLHGVADEELAKRPYPGAWSVKEVVGHLCDTEWAYGYRMRLMLSHESPPITGYDQDLMVTGMGHNDRPVSTLLKEFQRLREFNLELYVRTEGPAWERVGLHEERGPESVGFSVRLLAGHDLRHLKQVDRTLAEVRGTR